MADTDVEEEDGPVRFMSELVSLVYDASPSRTARRFAERLREGVIAGHKCPACGMVYVPPRGYCPLCVVETGDADEVTVADRGTVTTFTAITPIQYYGQEERNEYVIASILLDGASGTVGQQRIGDIAIEKVRTGMRVEGVWSPAEERHAVERGGLSGAITHWRPTGEPDVPYAEFEDHVL